jgi:tetratricopeptide (TPR) repeat protein
VGNFRKCISYLRLSIKVKLPDSKVSYLLSQAYERRGRFGDALFWAQKNMKEALLVRPGHYLTIANIYDLANHKYLAVDILKQGIDQLGLLPSLTTKLLQILVESGDVYQALEWQNKIVDSQARREFALFDRAKLYLSLGDFSEAMKDLYQVQSMVDNLPKHLRNSAAVVQLMDQSTALLQQIKKQDS